MQKATFALKADELNLAKAARIYSHADNARALLEAIRWPEGPVCPRCHFDQVYKLKPKKGFSRSTRKGVHKCAACRNQFTVSVGTILEGSRIPLSKWVMAVFILCSTREVISTRQLQRMLGITYKSTWRLAIKLRQALGKKLPLQHLPGNSTTNPSRWWQYVPGKGNDVVAPNEELRQSLSDHHDTETTLAITQSPILLPKGRRPKLRRPLSPSKRRQTRIQPSSSSRNETAIVYKADGVSMRSVSHQWGIPL